MIDMAVFEGENCTFDDAKANALEQVNRFIRRQGMTLPQDIIEYHTEIESETKPSNWDEGKDGEYLDYYKVRIIISYYSRERY